MPTIDVVWLAYLNRDIDDSGTDDSVNLTLNVDGDDVVDRSFGSNAGDSDAYLNTTPQLDPPFDSATLTDSSIRIGVRGSDAWGPSDVLVFGHSLAATDVAVPLAFAAGLTQFISTDPSEGPLTIPLRRVEPGDASTVIRRVLLLVHTQWSGGGVIPGGSSGTDSPIQLEVFAGENLVLREEIHDTSQADLERGESNWYVMDSLVPFTRGEVQAGGRIVLSILGDDAWKPMMLFVFGLDTESGRPNRVVSLVSLPIWGPRGMSTDTSEGDPSVDLQVTPG
jgi:hypothetical protein